MERRRHPQGYYLDGKGRGSDVAVSPQSQHAPFRGEASVMPQCTTAIRTYMNHMLLRKPNGPGTVHNGEGAR